MKQIDDTLNYINESMYNSYNRVYDITKEMDKDELIELIGNIFNSQQSKEHELLNHIFESDNLDLATKYAHTTQTYIAELDKSVEGILAKKAQSIKMEAMEDSLPENVIK